MANYKFRDVIDSLDYDELVKMQKDLDSGAMHITKFVNDKILERQKEHDKVCTSCFSPISATNTNTFTLIFGPDDFRKKATFCAIDCLEEFLGKLRARKIKNMESLVKK